MIPIRILQLTTKNNIIGELSAGFLETNQNHATMLVFALASFRQTDSGVRNTMLVLRFLHDLEHHLDAMNSQKIVCLGTKSMDGQNDVTVEGTRDGCCPKE